MLMPSPTSHERRLPMGVSQFARSASRSGAYVRSFRASAARNKKRFSLIIETAISLPTFGQAMLQQDSEYESHVQNSEPVGLATRQEVSLEAISNIWNRQTWTQETKHLWEKKDRPTSRTTQLLSLKKATSGYWNSNCRAQVRKRRKLV
jgi:hypothetical protein